MKNLLLKVLYFVIVSVFLVSLIQCKPAIDKEKALDKAAFFDMKHANSIIEKNTELGFAEDEKGRKDTLAMIATSLKNNDFNSVIKIGNEYINRYDLDNDVEYMLATALFQQGEYGKAAKHYLVISKTPDFEEKRMVKYYLALCYLRFDSGEDTASGIKLLKEIQADPGEQFKAHELQSLIDLFAS